MAAPDLTTSYPPGNHWRPSALFDPTPADKRYRELVDLFPEFPLLHLLGDLEHEQWIAMFWPWMKASPIGDTAYAELMAKSFDELGHLDRLTYCTRWANVAKLYIEHEGETSISPAAFERMERQEWDQTTHWVRYMLSAWNDSAAIRWRSLASLRYSSLSNTLQRSDRDMARRSLQAATGIKFGRFSDD